METTVRIVGQVIALVVVGALLGAATGTVCLLLLGLPHLFEWKPEELLAAALMGSYAGAPLGAVLGPVLRVLALRRVPAERIVLYAPLGTIAGSLIALLLGWLIGDIGDGIALFYLVGGAIVGVTVSAIVMRAKYRDYPFGDLI